MANVKRAKLISLSQVAKSLVEQGDYERVNDALLGMYSDSLGVSDSREDWGTFKNWREQGYAVCKGEKGYSVWGKKRKIEVKGANEDVSSNVSTEEQEVAKQMRYYPIATLFHKSQVESLAERQKRQEGATE